jgi:hypothetical protein
VLDESRNSVLVSALDVNHVMVARLDNLTAMVRNEKQVVVAAPAERQIRKQHGEDRIDFAAAEADGPRPALGDASPTQNGVPHPFVFP